MTAVPIRPGFQPETLLHQAKWLIEHHGNQTAVVLVDAGGETRITTETFFRKASQYAAALDALGVRPKDIVVSVLPHGEDVLFSFWGALMLGAVPSIFPFLTDKLDRERYFASVRTLVEHEDVRVIITYDDLEAPLKDALNGVSSLEGIINARTLTVEGNAAETLSRELPMPDDTAFLQHSSGSTGLQKGVMLSHRAVLNHIASYSEAIQLSPDDVIISWLPLYHDMGLIAAFMLPILQGIPLILMSPFHWVREPQIMLHAFTRHRGTLCWLPNFAFNFMAMRIRDAALEGVDLRSWRASINTSEPVSAESHRVFARRFAPYGLRPNTLLTSYGMAENTFAVSQSAVGATPPIDIIDSRVLANDRRAQAPLPDSDGKPVEMMSCGRVIRNCELRVLDDNGNDLPERHVGEFAIRSNSMLTGYYRRDDLTAQVLIDGWYMTGDMGYVADGELYVTGRKKDLIIVGGKNVYPQDLEKLLNDIPGLHAGRNVAFGVYNAQLGTEDIAVLAEVNQERLLDDASALSEIERTIRTRIAQNTEVTARHVRLLPSKWLIKTSSGKIARAANREKFLSEMESE